MKAIALLAIRGYKRYISPYTGFSCAHRVHLNGDSCSTFALPAIDTHGLSRVWLWPKADFGNVVKFIEPIFLHKSVSRKVKQDLLISTATVEEWIVADLVVVTRQHQTAKVARQIVIWAVLMSRLAFGWLLTRSVVVRAISHTKRKKMKRKNNKWITI